MNLEISEKVRKKKNYESEKPNSEENIVSSFLKRNFKIRVSRRNNKYYKILTLRGRSRK